jgi:hypothetical protein
MMTVGELKKKLARLSDDRLVLLYDEEREFPCHPLGDVKVRDVVFSEDPSGRGEGASAKEKCVVLHPE